MSDDILFGIEDGIARITINRPDRRNALTFAMYDRIRAIVEGLPQDGPVRAVVFRGAGGRAFAAGTDMAEFRGFAAPQDALDYERDCEAMFSAIERCPLPTIAAITGACTGGGAAIAACCDLRLGDAGLKFGIPVARTLGNCLSTANLDRLCALIGPGRTRELLLTARLIGADEAERIGLVTEILPDAPAVAARADALAARLATHAPLTMAATKEALRRLRTDGPAADGSDLIVRCYMSADFREGIDAFLAKRKPAWTGA